MFGLDDPTGLFQPKSFYELLGVVEFVRMHSAMTELYFCLFVFFFLVGWCLFFISLFDVSLGQLHLFSVF